MTKPQHIALLCVLVALTGGIAVGYSWSLLQPTHITFSEGPFHWLVFVPLAVAVLILIRRARLKSD